MVFSSATFVFYFLPFALVWTFGFHLLGAHIFSKKTATEITNINLTLLSIAFYAWGELENIWILLTSASATYATGLMILRYQSKKINALPKYVTFIGVLFNLSLLFYFKYYSFAFGIFSTQTVTTLSAESVSIPLGISFFTFQCVSYLLDVYWQKTTATRNPVCFFCYLTFFPQLIAGPIVRFASVSKDLTNRSISLENANEGFRRFSIGLAKKTLIANPIGKLSDDLFSIPASDITTLSSWLAAVCYGLQILFDFSGYSDMAIGLGKVFGINIPENFRQPYQAKSVRDFWRRWHISLSTWFRDYLYIPLGGNRTSKWRTGLNLIIVFFLCGLWHGASLNFIAWGLIHGTFLCIERYFPLKTSKTPLLLHLIGRGYALVIIISSWILFRSESLDNAGTLYYAMFLDFSYSPLLPKSFFSYETQAALLIALTISLSSGTLIKTWNAIVSPRISFVLITITLLILLSMSMLKIIVSTYDPFIYFRF